jgi:hypothetical protein
MLTTRIPSSYDLRPLAFCGAYSLDTLAYCLPLSPTQVTNVGHPVDTLLRLPLALALVRSSLLPSEWSAVHLIVPNPSALTCQDFKERKPDVLIC